MLQPWLRREALLVIVMAPGPLDDLTGEACLRVTLLVGCAVPTWTSVIAQAARVRVALYAGRRASAT